AVALGDALGLDHQLAGLRGVLDRQRRVADRPVPQRPLALAAQILQGAEATLVALAPRRHAVAQPVLLADDLALELVALALLFLQDLVARSFEGGESLLQPSRRPHVDPDHHARQRP